MIKQNAVMNIPQDKKKHFVAGFAITAIVSLFFGYIIGVIVAVIAAAGKELYDKVTGMGTPEVLDFVATIVGAAAAVIASVVLSSLYYCVFGT